MTDLRSAVADYLGLRRSLGFKLDRADWLLNSFVNHMEARGALHITIEVALEWATLPQHASSWWWRNRLGVARCFARYLQAIDPATEVPPAGLIAAVVPRAVPYMFSEADIAALMNAATRLDPPLRGETYKTLVGLLAVTGMRVSEAINLDDRDVDLDEALIVVRHAKFQKARELFLHPSTVDALGSYRQNRRRHQPRPSTAAFFVSTVGTRLHYPNVLGVFHRLTDEAALQERRNGHRPRMHDLRHRFAVQTVLDWYAAGLDAGPRMSVLSVHLGHAKPADTYWYLSATPELLGVAALRLEKSLEGLR
jgi:integrase